MNSRLGKYNDNNSSTFSRTKKNVDIYNNLDVNDLSRIKTNTNVSVISDSPKQIDIEKIKRYIYSKNEESNENKRRIKLGLPEENEVVVERKEPKDYDINSVLERARETKESDYEELRYRKLNNTEVDILNKIKIEDPTVDKDPDITEPISELNTQEKTIVDLINDISKTKITNKEDLFSELISDNENTVVMAPIKDETSPLDIELQLDNITQELNDLTKPLDEIKEELLLEKEKLDEEPPTVEKIDVQLEDKMQTVDKSFFTNSLSFNKKDFEGTDNIEEEKSSSFYSKFAIIMIIFVLLATAVIILNYVLELKWF